MYSCLVTCSSMSHKTSLFSFAFMSNIPAFFPRMSLSNVVFVSNSMLLTFSDSIEFSKSFVTFSFPGLPNILLKA